MNKIKKVIVIGAGASGIAAATRLYEQGIRNILVIEAENRIGGRIHTFELPNNDGTVEFGAQWIHGEEGNVVFEEASARNLIQKDGNFFRDKCVFVKSSSEILEQETSNKILEILHSVQKNIDHSLLMSSKCTADYYIPRLENGFEALHSDQINDSLKKEFIEWCQQTINSEDGCDSWFDSSISTLEEYWDCRGDPLVSWKKCGYRSILSVLMEKCEKMTNNRFSKENIIVNKPVEKIRLEDDGTVRVICADGNSYSADHVILTVSIGVLKEKHRDMFDGVTLPDKKILALNHFGFSSVNKIFIKYPRQWLPENINSLCLLWNEDHKEDYTKQGLDWLTDIFAFIRCPHAPNVLCGWIGGASSRKMEQLSEAEIKLHVTAMLQNLLGTSFDIPEADYCLRSTWSLNEHFRGVYSFRTPASDELGITADFLFSPIVNTNSIPVILFAGEATHPHYYSTVHGAIETGWREADRIIALNKT